LNEVGLSILASNGLSAVCDVMWVEFDHGDNIPCHRQPRNNVTVNTVLAFHQNWFYVAIATTGLVGLWGLVMALMKRSPPKAFAWATGTAIGAILIQVVAGVYLYSNELRPGNAFHVFYGVVIVITLTLAYVYRSTMARKPALTYGILLLFVMGLGLRAWSNVS
jgi:CDP-diglyceride synthetase